MEFCCCESSKLIFTVKEREKTRLPFGYYDPWGNLNVALGGGYTHTFISTFWLYKLFNV